MKYQELEQGIYIRKTPELLKLLPEDFPEYSPIPYVKPTISEKRLLEIHSDISKEVSRTL